jgi:histidine phosphotransfer protein HptB
MDELLNNVLIEELREIMEDEFPSLLETFLEESARQLVSAQNAWSDQDLDSLRRYAHSLKGSCANIGAEQLQASCAELESKAKAQEGDAIPSLLETVESQLTQVSHAVRLL